MEDPFSEDTTSNFMFHDRPKTKTRYGNKNIIPSIDKLQGTGGVDIEMETKNDVEENEFAEFMPHARKSKNQQIKAQIEQDESMYHQEQQQHESQKPPQTKKEPFQKTTKNNQQQQPSVLTSILKSSKKMLTPPNKNTDFETFVRFILPLIFFLQLVILFRVYFKKN